MIESLAPDKFTVVRRKLGVTTQPLCSGLKKGAERIKFIGFSSLPSPLMARPTEYKPEYCEKIIEFFNQPSTWTEEIKVTTAMGSTYTKKVIHPTEPTFLVDFAKKIGVSYSTLTRWEKKYPEFCNAYKEAKKLQERLLVTNGLLGHFNASFAIFTMKNVAGWRDKPEIEDEDYANMELEIITEEDRKEIRPELDKYLK